MGCLDDKVRRLDDGQLHVGAEARISQPRLMDATWRVTRLAPGKSFTWESRSVGAWVVGGHLVKGEDHLRSTVTPTVDQTGPLMALARPCVEGLTQRYLTMEVAGLKHPMRGPDRRRGLKIKPPTPITLMTVAAASILGLSLY